MFSKEELRLIAEIGKEYRVIRLNGHDVHLHSLSTGHDWIIISHYQDRRCIVMHRHCSRDPFHRQHGHYESLWDALEYIRAHDANYKKHHKPVKNREMKE